MGVVAAQSELGDRQTRPQPQKIGDPMPARKPSYLHEISGAYAKNPARRRARALEPVPAGPLGEMPSGLPPDVARAWDEIVGLVPAGVLAISDRLAVEHAARLLALLREKEWLVPPPMLLRFEAAIGRLGLSPTDRARIRTDFGRGIANDTPGADFDF